MVRTITGYADDDFTKGTSRYRDQYRTRAYESNYATNTQDYSSNYPSRAEPSNSGPTAPKVPTTSEAHHHEDVIFFFASIDDSVIIDAFAAADIDGSGALDMDELRAVLLASREKRLAQRSDEEDEPVEFSEADVQDIFASCDTSNDGRVSLNELLKAKRKAKVQRDKIVKSRSIASYLGTTPPEPKPQPEKKNVWENVTSFFGRVFKREDDAGVITDAEVDNLFELSLLEGDGKGKMATEAATVIAAQVRRHQAARKAAVLRVDSLRNVVNEARTKETADLEEARRRAAEAKAKEEAELEAARQLASAAKAKEEAELEVARQRAAEAKARDEVQLEAARLKAAEEEKAREAAALALEVQEQAASLAAPVVDPLEKLREENEQLRAMLEHTKAELVEATHAKPTHKHTKSKGALPKRVPTQLVAAEKVHSESAMVISEPKGAAADAPDASDEYVELERLQVTPVQPTSPPPTLERNWLGGTFRAARSAALEKEREELEQWKHDAAQAKAEADAQEKVRLAALDKEREELARWKHDAAQAKVEAEAQNKARPSAASPMMLGPGGALLPLLPLEQADAEAKTFADLQAEPYEDPLAKARAALVADAKAQELAEIEKWRQAAQAAKEAEAEEQRQQLLAVAEAKKAEQESIDAWRRGAAEAKDNSKLQGTEWQINATAVQYRDERDLARCKAYFPDHCPHMLYFRQLRGLLGCVHGDATKCERGSHVPLADFQRKISGIGIEWPKGIDTTKQVVDERRVVEAERKRRAEMALKAAAASVRASVAFGKAKARPQHPELELDDDLFPDDDLEEVVTEVSLGLPTPKPKSAHRGSRIGRAHFATEEPELFPDESEGTGGGRRGSVAVTGIAPSPHPKSAHRGSRLERAHFATEEPELFPDEPVGSSSGDRRGSVAVSAIAPTPHKKSSHRGSRLDRAHQQESKPRIAIPDEEL